jgi:hypothetical protein
MRHVQRVYLSTFQTATMAKYSGQGQKSAAGGTKVLFREQIRVLRSQ